MLLPLAWLACAPPDDTDTGRLALDREVDSATGAYHLVLTLEPEPPVVGEQTGQVDLTENHTDNPSLDGTLIAGANLTGQLTAPEDSSLGPLDVAFSEGPSGSYVATWTWPGQGYWELDVDVGNAAASDTATLAMDVEPAR